jgi:hypothetical protein
LPKTHSLSRGQNKTINIIDSDEEDNNDGTATTSSGWLEKTSHQTTALKKKKIELKIKPKPIKSSSGPNKKKPKIILDSDESEDFNLNDDEDDEEEAEAELDEPKEKFHSSLFKEMAPTVIYQLHEDNISKLLKEREQGTKKFRTQRNLESSPPSAPKRVGKSAGCSLSHTSAKTSSGNGGGGRLLKKRIRSLSLTDSDVESVESREAPPTPPERVLKKREIIVLGSDEEEEEREGVALSVSSSNSSQQKMTIKPKTNRVIESLNESEEGSAEEEEEEEEEEGSFQSEGSDDDENEKNNASDDGGSSGDGGGGKWYGSESESEQSDEGTKRKKRRGGGGRGGGGGSEDERDEEDLRQEMERKCRRVLQRCGDVSKLLRQALLSWNDPSAAVTPGAPGVDANGVGSCVSLISLSTGGGENIISQDLITKKISTKLVLKDYQLVGLNWMKLMHTNDVNGVLADDMGLG